MDRKATFFHELDEHTQAVNAIKAVLGDAFFAMVDACVASLAAGGKILLFGNGGSAADAQHLAAELVVRFRKDRPSLAAIALTTDTSALTAIGNDFGFDDLFSRQIEGLGCKGDVAIGISTSGNSKNVLKALHVAREIGLVTVGLGGGDGGKLAMASDIVLVIPSKTTARIQECHILLGHMLCGAIEAELGYA